MPIRKKPYSRRRKRSGNFPALLLLATVVGGLIWFWWHPKPPGKPSKPKPLTATPRPTSDRSATPVTPVENRKPKPPIVPPPAPVVPQPRPIPPPLPVIVAEPPPVTPPVVVSQPPPSPPVVPPSPAAFPRPVRDALEAQIALARRAISPGSLDDAIGPQTRAAIAAFQRSQKLLQTGVLDTNTRPQLSLEAPLLTTCTVTSNDIARLQPLGKTWLEKSRQTALDYESILELIAEKSHAHPLLIQKLNPSVNWTNVAAGTVLKIPDVEYPEPDGKAAIIVIHLSERFIEAFDGETNLLAHFPCSIAAKVEKRPVGKLHVTVIAEKPNYTFDPEVFPESPEAQSIGHKLILPSGPNNPVGLAWIGLDKPGYGMHGTPTPQQVGLTESHGCFRLANWDAEYLLKLVWIGMPVEVKL